MEQKQRLTLTIAIMVGMMSTSAIYAQTAEQGAMYSNQAAKLLGSVSDIAVTCTVNIQETNVIPQDCILFSKEVRDALKPIVEKYEESILYNDNLGSNSNLQIPTPNSNSLYYP